jgi:NADPH:quinone reductase-like Zn-dependent oxidoreductase
MKAVVYTRYGPPDVLRFTDVETPAQRGTRRAALPREGHAEGKVVVTVE